MRISHRSRVYIEFLHIAIAIGIYFICQANAVAEGETNVPGNVENQQMLRHDLHYVINDNSSTERELEEIWDDLLQTIPLEHIPEFSAVVASELLSVYCPASQMNGTAMSPMSNYSVADVCGPLEEAATQAPSAFSVSSSSSSSSTSRSPSQRTVEEDSILQLENPSGLAGVTQFTFIESEPWQGSHVVVDTQANNSVVNDTSDANESDRSTFVMKRRVGHGPLAADEVSTNQPLTRRAPEMILPGMSGALNVSNGEHRKRLVIVVPFIESQWDRVMWLLVEWRRNPPCQRNPPLSMVLHTELVFYFHRTFPPHMLLELEGLVEPLNEVRRCFGRIRFRSRELTENEDKYFHATSQSPGPNRMFFDLLNSRDIRGNADLLFYYEPDVMPVRPYWLTRLYDELSVDNWVTGSPFRGEYKLSRSGWLHINGNAVYRVGKSGFDKWTARADGFRNDMPFDAALYEVRSLRPYRLDAIKNKHRFEYTETWINQGECPYTKDGIRRNYSTTMLVHGSWPFVYDDPEKNATAPWYCQGYLRYSHHHDSPFRLLKIHLRRMKEWISRERVHPKWTNAREAWDEFRKVAPEALMDDLLSWRPSSEEGPQFSVPFAPRKPATAAEDGESDAAAGESDDAESVEGSEANGSGEVSSSPSPTPSPSPSPEPLDPEVALATRFDNLVDALKGLFSIVSIFIDQIRSHGEEIPMNIREFMNVSTSLSHVFVGEYREIRAWPPSEDERIRQLPPVKP